jgi:hypothetical protein
METAEPTWQPHERHGDLTTRSDLPDTVFAFPKERKEPLTDAAHVRNAVARFDQVTDDDEAAGVAAMHRSLHSSSRVHGNVATESISQLSGGHDHMLTINRWPVDGGRRSHHDGDDWYRR